MHSPLYLERTSAPCAIAPAGRRAASMPNHHRQMANHVPRWVSRRMSGRMLERLFPAVSAVVPVTGMRAGLCGLLLACALVPVAAQAQVQRSFVNASFEQPALVTPGCRVYIAESQVPGYSTTHPAQVTENVGGCVVPAGFAQTAPIMELWRTPRDNGSGGAVNAPEGVQIAELNAAVASRIYQSVCLINGETVAWRFLHRGRGSATVPDQAEFKLGAAGTVVRVGTTNNGTFLAPVTSIGTSNPPSNAAGNATWVRYSGSFQHPYSTGITNLGFEAIGGTTSGNLLDDIQIDLKPFVEFAQASSSTPEGSTSNRPTLRVDGTAFQDIVVTIQVFGGTATLGTDYTTPTGTDTFSVTIPGSAAGTVYDGGAASLFPLPVTVINDALVEGNETVQFRIVPPATTAPAFMLNSSTVCGGSAQATWLWTIVDDDSGVTVTKNSSAPVPVPGQPALFDVSYTILVANTSPTLAANYSLSDTPGFDPDVAVVSAAVALNGGAPTALPIAAPWTLQPQWRALAANQTDTYVLTVRGSIARGGTAGNDACADPGAAGNGLYNVATAVVQGSGGNPGASFSDAACEPTPTPAWILLRKQLSGRAAATDQAQVRIYAGGTVAATATTSGSSVPATAATPLLVVPAGTTLQFDEALKTNGTGPDRALTGYLPQIVCTSTGATVANLPTGAGTNTGTRQLWPDFTGVSGADVDCTITNTPISADLSITKTNNSSNAVAGLPTNYVLEVRNGGPDAADGAVLRDPAVAGLQCTAVSCTSQSGGAICPVVSIAALQGTGITLSTLPAGGALVFTVECTPQ